MAAGWIDMELRCVWLVVAHEDPNYPDSSERNVLFRLTEHEARFQASQLEENQLALRRLIAEYEARDPEPDALLSWGVRSAWSDRRRDALAADFARAKDVYVRKLWADTGWFHPEFYDVELVLADPSEAT